jgi:Carboxypeptidase regulatory-like domain
MTKGRSVKSGAVGGDRSRGIGLSVTILVTVILIAHTISPIVAAQEQQRIPGQAPVRAGAIAGTIRDQDGIGVANANVEFRSNQAQNPITTVSDGEGIYRQANLLAGDYQVTVTANGFEPASASVSILPAQLQVLDFRLKSIANPAKSSPGPGGIPGPARTAPLPPVNDMGNYPLFRGPEPANAPYLGPPEVLPNESDNFATEPYRWTVEMPAWQRYGKEGEFPYVTPHWYDPFNRNRLKGDTPIFGQRWFLNFTGTSLTQTDVRRLPTPSNVSSEEPGSRNFFGRGEQAFVDQSFRFSFDLFRGDTSFQPVEFRIRVTPVVDLNFLQTRELGIVNVDVKAGTNRFDTHTGLQEAFLEAKIHDLSPNFDFVSVRAGIQGFSSDFRGFIFVDEDPAIRVFGNLRSNRVNYNLAYFYLLEKDTNSGLNTFQARHQQVGIANVYIQDFFAKGYTTEFSFHYNYDQGGIEFDKNGFLVRPAPIGSVVMANGIPVPHDIRSYYLGWTGNGHIRGLNVSNAFYQALGTDSFNSIAGRPLHINAQMGALELSKDKDWLRFRGSIFWASGDSESRVGPSRTSGTARGFDSIMDDMQFAGGPFSFWNSEGIRLTGTGVDLTTPFSLLPDLRSSKIQGQSNFVNPGVRVYNAGIDADLTPKLRAFVNVNYLQFDRTETLTYLLFQSNVHRGIGTDSGVGISYRPPLTENMVLTAGVSSLVPDSGLRNIYNSRVLISGFANLRIQF